MPYGEEIIINVGDAVTIHPNYKNYKFKKLLYGETYLVKELHTDYDKKVKVLETEYGFLIRLNMDKRYFEHAGKGVVLEPTYERNYELFIGDVILVTTSGYGLIDEDEGKYVEVIGKGNYFDDPGVEVKPYQCVLETSKGCGSIGDQGVIGYESFGTAPMILLNTLEEQLVDEVCRGREGKTFNPSLETRKNDKNQMELVDTGFPNALLMLGEVMTWAAKNKGYLVNDWKDIPNPQMSLLGAASRHRNKRLKGEESDDESGLPHLAHECFNVIAQLELLIMGKL